jgi:hypothetical protein
MGIFVEYERTYIGPQKFLILWKSRFVGPVNYEAQITMLSYYWLVQDLWYADPWDERKTPLWLLYAEPKNLFQGIKESIPPVYVTWRGRYDN